jgi:carboxyl-terminal processing protease
MRKLKVSNCFWILLALTALSRLQASERITENQVASLVPRLFDMHLKQHAMDAAFMRRTLKEFLTQLDPGKCFFLKSEADAIVNQSDADISRLEDHVLQGDLSNFRVLLSSFVEKQTARDEALYAGLDKFGEAVKGGKPATPPPATDDGAAQDPKIPTAAEDDDDKINWQEYPQTNADREARLLRRTRNTFEGNRAYLSESDAFTLALQTVRRERQKWVDMSAADRDAETPKLFLRSFMNAMDPHTDYFDDDEEEFSGRLERNFAGIGIQIRPCPLGVYVEEIIKGGPSERSANLFPGDQITAVDGYALAGLPITRSVKRIKGERGTDVRLTVLRRGTKKSEDVSLRRDTVELAGLRVKGKTIAVKNLTIGVVSVQTFYRGVHNDIRDRLRELSGRRQLDGVVLDLRGNHGGYLDEAIGVAGLFLDRASVVGERDSDGKIDWKDSSDSPYYSGPLVVLTNQFSASASEIVAGALQDHNRALVVSSSQTFGKGTVQRVVQLSMYNAPGEIKITTHQYFLPSGNSVQSKGVEPDVAIPGPKLDKDSLESGNENALPFARIDSHTGKMKGEFRLRTEWKARLLADIMARSKERITAAKTEWADAFDTKKKRAADAAKAAKDPNEAPPPADPAKDEKDLQAIEAAAIAADIGESWPHWSREAATSDR